MSLGSHDKQTNKQTTEKKKNKDCSIKDIWMLQPLDMLFLLLLLLTVLVMQPVDVKLAQIGCHLKVVYTNKEYSANDIFVS